MRGYVLGSLFLGQEQLLDVHSQTSSFSLFPVFTLSCLTWLLSPAAYVTHSKKVNEDISWNVQQLIP